MSFYMILFTLTLFFDIFILFIVPPHATVTVIDSTLNSYVIPHSELLEFDYYVSVFRPSVHSYPWHSPIYYVALVNTPEEIYWEPSPQFISSILRYNSALANRSSFSLFSVLPSFSSPVQFIVYNTSCWLVFGYLLV